MEQRVMVELPSDEAQALSALLNGLGWGSVDRVAELVRARRRVDQALRVEGLPSCEPRKAA